MMEAKAVLAFDSAFICFSFPNLGVEFARIYNSITMSNKSDFYRVQLCNYFKTVLEVAKTGSIGGLSDRNRGIFAGRDEGEGRHRRRPSPTAPRPVGQSSVSSPLKGGANVPNGSLSRTSANRADRPNGRGCRWIFCAVTRCGTRGRRQNACSRSGYIPTCRGFHR